MPTSKGIKGDRGIEIYTIIIRAFTVSAIGDAKVFLVV
jgi:hypothetical protein